MTTFTLVGTDSSFLEHAFFSEFDEVDIEMISSSSTRVVATNPWTGYSITLVGSGFRFANDEPIGGTLTNIVDRALSA